VKRKETGQLGEQLAKSFLQKKGYRIVETNCRCGKDEIDIIAYQKDYLVFIEVRTKSNLGYGLPEESLTVSKMRHMERAAINYLQSHDNVSALWRVDLVAVELDSKNKPLRIEVIENALEF
jgi:putative endonuclease